MTTFTKCANHMSIKMPNDSANIDNEIQFPNKSSSCKWANICEYHKSTFPHIFYFCFCSKRRKLIYCIIIIKFTEDVLCFMLKHVIAYDNRIFLLKFRKHYLFHKFLFHVLFRKSNKYFAFYTPNDTVSL